MNTWVGQTKSEARGEFQGFLKVREEWKMRLATGMTKLKMRISRNMTSKIAVKLVTTAIGLTFSSTNADATANPLSTEGVEVSTEGAVKKGYLNRGRAGYSVKEQMELAEVSFSTNVAPRKGRAPAYLNQGQAGYSIK